MFGRGSWAVFGVKAASQAIFEASLAPSSSVSSVSQATAILTTKSEEVPSTGINPYNKPRGDEEETPVQGVTEDYRLGPQQFGFWFVLNDFEDVTHPKSKQEGIAYENAQKPFKFLKKEEKELVESQVAASAVVARKQFPVLIDFVGERVYAETTNVEEIGALRTMLEDLGVKTYNLAWQFGGFDWNVKFVNAIREGNMFDKQMRDRADDLRRFRPDEIEKLEDKMMENIVSSYFALAELETGQWAGLSVPAKIRLFAASEPSGETSVSTAFTLLNLVEDAQVASAAVTFQALDSKFNKKGEEKQYRTDLFTIDINDKVNISDAGSAALRGFDMPQYKKDMKRHGKDRGALTVQDYWIEWLVGMKTSVNIFVDNVTETLKLDKKLGLLAYEGSENSDAAGAE